MRWTAFAAITLALAGASEHAQTPGSSSGARQFVSLDHVVALINGDVLLESDVDEELHFAALEPFQANTGDDTRQSAMSRLINRDLIVQQMKEQQQVSVNISDADVEKSLAELRGHLPACARYDCTTTNGWNSFLAENDLTNQEVEEHWKQRLAILQFIDQRFRSGIRISHESIDDYYAKSVVPAFEKQHEHAPPLNDVSARIQEVLLQQQVNGLLRDWLRSLRDEGSVQILDPAYQPAAGAAGSDAGEEE
jgi:peptidyl-prolyl cis-trans isomerase SurA